MTILFLAVVSFVVSMVVITLCCLLRGHPEDRQERERELTLVDVGRQKVNIHTGRAHSSSDVPVPLADSSLPVSSVFHPLNPITDPFNVYGSQDSSPACDSYGSDSGGCDSSGGGSD